MHACAQAGTIVPHSFYLQAVEMRRFVTIGKVHACNYLSTNYRYARTVKGIYRKPKLLREESEVTDVFATAIIGKGKESEERTPLQVPVASTSHIGGSKEAWSWIPPVSRDGPSKVIEKNKLEIKKGYESSKHGFLCFLFLVIIYELLYVGYTCLQMK
ncbi:hypothetical protein EON65_17040 [archaeon]|nr:MAG: hypothetical protein EON65_17040 [archaeon]